MRLSVLPRVRGHSRARAAAFTGALLGLLATSPLLQPLPAAATSLNVALVSSAEWREHLNGLGTVPAGCQMDIQGFHKQSWHFLGTRFLEEGDRRDDSHGATP